MAGDDLVLQEVLPSPRPPSVFALALDQLCSSLDTAVNAALCRLDSRLEASERAARAAKLLHSTRLLKAVRDREELDNQLRQQRRQRQREASERREEKQWLAELWPNGAPLPTLLHPFATAGDEAPSVQDADERRRLEALAARRAMRERVRRRLEEAKQWTMVVPADGEGDGDGKPYYAHAETGESTWEAPAALFFEPPEGWDAATMDWKASYSLEHFNPKAEEPEQETEDSAEFAIGDDGGADNEDEDEAKALDPVECRREMEQVMETHARLEMQLEQSRTKQRALAQQLHGASREAFEREQEALQLEDAAVKDAERKRRRAEQQEQAAARAKEEAAARRKLEAENPGQALATFGRDSVARKGLTLAKDDGELEKALEAFAIEQRVDRPYLTAPVAVDQRVKVHHQLDAEFLHVKRLECEVRQAEQLEFDLLEKTSLRHEEAAVKSDELKQLAERIRVQQVEVADEIPRLEATIQRLDVPLEAPTDRRPTEGELQRANERFISLDGTAGDAEGDRDGLEEQEHANMDEDSRPSASGLPAATTLEPAARLVAEDESELRALKQFVDVERQWQLWCKEEEMRQQELTDALARRIELEKSQRSLAVDLALCEADAAFFERLRDLEKAGNTRMWAVQADSQVERVRFMIERAAREEAVFQATDRLKELQEQLVEAQRLPLQAVNAVERLELEQTSVKLVRDLEVKLIEQRGRLAKEEQAKTLLLELELRASRYVQEKLKEEEALFSEKQALWDLNAQLVDEVQAERQVIARLYQLVESGGQVEGVDEASRVFEAKLKLQQEARQFLLSCYEREARWRSLAAIALAKDTTSEQWMTAAQRERHEQMLALLQEQHDEREAVLQRELRLRAKVEAQLQQHIDQLGSRMDRMRREYQASDDAVRLETRLVIEELQREIEQLHLRLGDELRRYRAERERLLSSHDAVRLELEQRLQQLETENEAQRHWLTASKRELKAQRVANEELLKAVQALEQRRATEVNDLRFRVAAQVAKINSIEMWNLALRLQAKEASAARVTLAKEFAAKTEQHRQLQRLLRLQVWRHRVTAQAVLSDVNLLFAFFAEGLKVLAGATKASNDALRENAGIQVLAALATHSSQPRVRAITAKALGLVAWNANATARAVGWRAKRTWLSWVRTQSDAVLARLSADQLEFDAVAGEASTRVNWLDDPATVSETQDGDGGEPVAGKKLRFIRSWLHVEDRELPDENAANQEHIGLTPGVLQALVDLCQPSDKDDSRVVQRNALESLALVAMNTRNTAIVGRLDGTIPLLARLLRPPTSDVQGSTAVDKGHLSAWETVRCAVRALSNLAFENRHNQQQIVAVDGGAVIPQLLSYCEPQTSTVDVDLALASVQALANLVGDFTPASELVAAAGGVSTLTRLCNSPLVHDAVDLGVSEAIQAHAALVLSRVVTLLDGDDCEMDGRGVSVADAIMEHEQQQHGAGVAAFVLMCASCTRDVAFHGALVLGIIARHDAIRAAIGAAGGVDALFLLASTVPDYQAEEQAEEQRGVDVEMLAQATWALANLTWSRDNQYRVARYLHVLLRLCLVPEASGSTSNQEATSTAASSPSESSTDESDALQLGLAVREHALCVLANSLFYNDANRQLVAADAAWLELLERVCRLGAGLPLEHAARALCALSYNDEIALAMGSSKLSAVANSSSSNNASEHVEKAELPFNGLAVFVKLCEREQQPEVQRLALSGIINLLLHDANKSRLLRVPLGVETLVNLSAHSSPAVREPALEALELLADVRQASPQLAGVSTVGGQSADSLRRLVALVEAPESSSAVVAMASDAIADEAWKRPAAKALLRNAGALDALIRRCSTSDTELPAPTPAALVSSLWALRNVVASNTRNQDMVGALGGVATLVALLDAARGQGEAQEDVAEASLAALAAVVTGHARNSQELVRGGLDALLLLADREDNKADSKAESTADARLEGQGDSKGKRMLGGARVETAALARQLLQLVAPHNALPPLAASPQGKVALRQRQRQQQQPKTTSLPALGGR